MDENELYCGKCGLSIANQDCIQCTSLCNLWYHKECTGLSGDSFNAMLADRRRRWKCDWCISCINLNKTVNVPIHDADTYLPAYDIVVNPFAPNNLFRSHEAWLRFEENVNNAYTAIACYRKNLFNIPSETVGKEFIKELTFWLSQLNSASSTVNSVVLHDFTSIDFAETSC